ncbi:hypothetical protein [Saccharopolyspora pogona]|uniref:hypothetical protein n=1 Tax=Saccharopolyspora pogona TaxID=333966 RepID=UPI001CC23D7A|nr:hypothetical protein [Saccharopolyspora pogona]
MLFERDSHHVQLTDAGAALLPIAKDVLGRLDDIPWRLHEAVSPQRAVVYIGIPPGLHSSMRQRLKASRTSAPPSATSSAGRAAATTCSPAYSAANSRWRW